MAAWLTRNTISGEDENYQTHVEKARDHLTRISKCWPTSRTIRRPRAAHLSLLGQPILGLTSAAAAEVLPVPELHWDHFSPKDHIGGNYVATSVIKDRQTKMALSHVVPVTGSDQEWVTEKLERQISNMMCKRSDQSVRSKACMCRVTLTRIAPVSPLLQFRVRVLRLYTEHPSWRVPDDIWRGEVFSKPQLCSLPLRSSRS